MKLPRLTRRNLLLGGAGLGVVALGVGGYAASASNFDFFKAMLRAQLPGVTISDQTIRDFSEAALIGRQSDFAPKLKALSAFTRLVGFDSAFNLMQNTDAFEKFNRDLLTLFLLGSNFFSVADPTAEEIFFTGLPAACPNPFAQFEPPA